MSELRAVSSGRASPTKLSRGLPPELDAVCVSVAHISFRSGGPFSRDDLIQRAREAVLQALRRHDSRERGLASFIAKVCRWRIADAYRKAAHEPTRSLVEGVVEREAAEAQADGPDDSLKRLEGVRQARRMLEAVSLRQRRALALAYLDDRSNVEIAEELGITAAAAKQLRTRGIASLGRLAD